MINKQIVLSKQERKKKNAKLTGIYSFARPASFSIFPMPHSCEFNKN